MKQIGKLKIKKMIKLVNQGEKAISKWRGYLFLQTTAFIIPTTAFIFKLLCSYFQLLFSSRYFLPKSGHLLHLHSFEKRRFRDVAQPGSALVWGARGRWFESSHPDETKARTIKSWLFFAPNCAKINRSSTQAML
jgi:hypothetical protein